MDAATLIRTSVKLTRELNAIRRLYGDKWRNHSQPYRARIERDMRRRCVDSPIEAAIPIAKDMSEHGHNPIMLLAVAAEMSEGRD